jgi:hypothetical protein
VFTLCFHCRNMSFWYISHVYQNTYALYILYEMHNFASVFMCFYCVFTVFSLQKHLLLVHVTCIYQNTHVPYILHEMHSFASVFMCFYCVFTAETCTFSTFSCIQKIHMYHIFYMKCTILLAFLCVFTVFSLQKHLILVHFTCIYQNTDVPYILHKMHSFASVFICFHCVFTAETCTFGTFHMYIPKYTCTIYSTCNAQFC